MLIHKKLLLTVLLLILSQSAIVLNQQSTTIPLLNSGVTNLISNPVEIPILVRPVLTQEADVYFGSS